jgi:protein-S-isoprenylcysteine O-methyltransferase Ste14
MRSKRMRNIPPTYFYACIIGIVLVFFLFPQFNIISFPYNLVGIVFLVLGFYFVIDSYYTFKSKGTSEDFTRSTRVVDSGLYGLSRNPMYIGGLLLLVAICILFGNILSFVFTLVFFLIINFKFIPFEEEKMEKEQGKAYIEYKNKVRRWL